MPDPVRVVDHNGYLLQGDGTAVSANIIAQNTFSLSAEFRGYFMFILSGTWVATVWFQVSFDDGDTWMDVQSFTSNTAKVGFIPEAGVLARFGVKSGGFTSGTVVGRLSQ